MTWQTAVDQALAANPNASYTDILNAAASAGITYDPATGKMSYGNETYYPTLTSAQTYSPPTDRKSTRLNSSH